MARPPYKHGTKAAGRPEALAESIRFALHEAELRAGASPESALIGMGGCVTGVNSRGIYEFGRRREIEADDLRYAVELAARVRMEEDRQVLQICPQDFMLDGRSGYRNPKGILVRAPRSERARRDRFAAGAPRPSPAVHLAHLAVEESVFEAIAAAYAAVLPEDRARGVALIDIGAHSTEVAIYDGDALLMAAQHSHRRRALHARYFLAVQSELRLCRNAEARIRLRGGRRGVRK